LVKNGTSRSDLIDKLGLPFLIHRSFSWLVLILLVFITWKNEKEYKYISIRLAFITLVVELISGVLLAYAEMPGLVQTAHLVFASILLGILWYISLGMRSFKVIK
jgi:cytochrome c oxidase assembly protein subunit 15